MAYKYHISKEIRVVSGHLLTFVHSLDIICTWIGIFGEQITAVFQGGSSWRLYAPTGSVRSGLA